jgi:hypothetical protein
MCDWQWVQTMCQLLCVLLMAAAAAVAAATFLPTHEEARMIHPIPLSEYRCAIHTRDSTDPPLLARLRQLRASCASSTDMSIV